MTRSLKLTLALSLAVATMILTAASSCQTSTSSQSSNSGATEVEFTVTGTAPNGVDITYGSDGSNYQGHLPLDTTLTIVKHAMYYDVNAQLQGGGSITCTIKIGNEIRTGHATGGYNICSAQLNSDFSGGWS